MSRSLRVLAAVAAALLFAGHTRAQQGNVPEPTSAEKKRAEAFKRQWEGVRKQYPMVALAYIQSQTALAASTKSGIGAGYDRPTLCALFQYVVGTQPEWCRTDCSFCGSAITCPFTAIDPGDLPSEPEVSAAEKCVARVEACWRRCAGGSVATP